MDMFIKIGDNEKITHVIETEDELTEKQKKNVKKIIKKKVKKDKDKEE
jgi:hypothetical protein